jgi:hypothetical protein
MQHRAADLRWLIVFYQLQVNFQLILWISSIGQAICCVRQRRALPNAPSRAAGLGVR